MKNIGEKSTGRIEEFMATPNYQTPNYVLDSFALVAYFQAEPGGEIVSRLLERAQRSEISLYLSIMNMGEVFYITLRELGNDIAESLINDIHNLPIQIRSVTDDNVMSAARLKGQYTFSFCDAFATTLAQELQASVVTGDPEFRNVRGIINIEWLPQNQ